MDEIIEADVFFSYAHEDFDAVNAIGLKLEECGLRTFIADRDLRGERRGTEGWENALLGHLARCRFFVLYCSRSANCSTWVNRETEHFYNECYRKDDRRKMFALQAPKAKDCVPKLLRSFLHPQSEEGLFRDVITAQLASLREEASVSREKLKEAFDHYGHKRFWEPLAGNRDIHIFTCGRDASDSRDFRGEGGRTNIDRWDYRSVLEITHFFAENYPSARVTIEDPVAKLSESELRGVHHNFPVANRMRNLEDKDCVIVGSPDVSDFAEITWAELHGIAPYAKDRVKKRGFAIIKPKMGAPSSTYWVKRADEQEGVKWIDGDEAYEVTRHSGEGSTYGILVVCNNPFSRSDQNRKIIILARFTGVATYGMARLLTSHDCLDQFFEIDQRYGALDTDFEALVEVTYRYDAEAEDRDTRRLNEDGRSPIAVKRMVEIGRPRRMKR